MKYYFSEIFTRIQGFSKRLDNFALLTNQNWVSINDIENQKNVFIFMKNNQLVISENGKVNKTKWEYLPNQSILIEINNECFLFKHGFLDENVLALKLDGSNSYALFVNETKYKKDFDSSKDVLIFLENKYVNKNKSLIDSKPKYYVLENLKEKGPYNIDELRALVDKRKINPFCFTRRISETNYNNKIRIRDLFDQS